MTSDPAASPPRVSLDELDQAVQWLSAALQAGIEAAAFVDRRSGRVIWQSDEVDEEVPADIEDEALYLRVPDSRELELGSRLVFRFVREQMPDHYGEVRAIFDRRGAYGRFKSFLESRGRLDAWHRYEEQAATDALRDWATENGLQVGE